MSDVLVVGGGIFGLSVARACRKAGLSVTLADREGPGRGASGGPVGALSPFPPADEGWTALKAFQLEALLSLPAEIAALEAETGVAAGYARTGRLSPLASPGARARAEAQAAAAPLRWPEGALYEVLDAVPQALFGMLSPDAAPHGVIRDSLTARIDPAAYAGAVAASLGGARLLTGWTLRRIEPGAGVFDRGRVPAAHVVLAAGWETMRLLGLDSARAAVKGQAAILDAFLPADAPVLRGPGLYVCAHGAGRIGVGSTREPGRTDRETDAGLDAVLETARALCPAIAHAPVRARWAGVRPRAPAPGPMAGPVSGSPGLWVATGGGGIGLALAHAIGRGLAAAIAGDAAPALPAGFLPGAHGL